MATASEICFLASPEIVRLPERASAFAYQGDRALSSSSGSAAIVAWESSVDVGADGRVYVAEAKAGRLIAYDPKDKSKSVIAEGLKIGLPAAEGTLPAYTTTGVAVSKKDGSVYVASDITNAIYRITPPAK